MVLTQLWMDDRGSKKIEEEAGERRRDDRDMVSVERLYAPFDGIDLGHMAGTLLRLREGINRATVRPPLEPPPGIERGARIQDIYFAYLVFFMLCPPPMSFYHFVLWILVIVYVARFVNLLGFLAFFMSLGMFGSMGTWMAVSSPIHG
ncbi:unnamed protein product [Cuscuta epithymum]|uniref:Uncharacterized protein n=1 Tax=Cuscuta epithymum TaxID=186058 RepID=A0AAV0E2G0_9ASTE|nr:unnamed protein product [Cuscuta epithymum]